MIYPDIDYINELYFLIMKLSYYIRKSKTLSEDRINEMESLTISLLDMLELYKQDKYYDDF